MLWGFLYGFIAYILKQSHNKMTSELNIAIIRLFKGVCLNSGVNVCFNIVSWLNRHRNSLNSHLNKQSGGVYQMWLYHTLYIFSESQNKEVFSPYKRYNPYFSKFFSTFEK